MQISDKIKDALKANWGDRAESMNCYAELKFIDEFSNWACYVFAMNPDNEDEIYCLLTRDFLIQPVRWSLQEIYEAYNYEGEHPQIDKEFRRIRVAELFKKLSEGK